MDIIRKIQYLLFCLLAIGFVACDDDDNNSTETGHEGILTQLAEEVDAHQSGKLCRCCTYF